MTSKWEERSLGELVRFTSGGTPDKSNTDYWNGNIPWISAKTMKEERISTSDLRISEAGLAAGSRIAPVNSLLLLTRGSGLFKGIPLCIVEKPVAYNQDVKCITPQSDVNMRFIFYWLKSQAPYMAKKLEVTGIGAGKFDTAFLQGLRVCYPPKIEQEAIVAIADSISDRIETNKAINHHLEQMAQAIFKSWFVDFEPFGGKQPQNWLSVNLGTLSSLLTRGIAPKYVESSEQRIINQRCIRNHMVDLSLARTHSPKLVNEKWLQYGDLLVNSTGEGTLGRVAPVWFMPHNLTVDSHVTIIRPVTKELIYFVGLWGITHERELEALHTGSTGQTELPRECIKTMVMSLPDNDVLSKFNAVIMPIAASLVSNQEESIRLVELRDTLLPRLMAGELSVADVDKAK